MKKRLLHTPRNSRTKQLPRARGTALHPLPTEGMVEQRARELAEADGRNNVLGSDRIQAKKELTGSPSVDAPTDDSGIIGSGMGVPPTSRGKMATRELPTDDQTEEQTVQEGVDEAEHDITAEATKNERRRD